ncbi:MAG: nucleotidyltransferase family protein [Candidatus Anstonellales archaeon]
MKKAFVLCGGKGTRLRPLTYAVPKPMLPVGRKPILEFVLANLKRNGFNDVTLAVGYLKEHIKNYFGDGSKFGVRIDYLEEASESGTAGCILPAKSKIKDTFLVVMGDHLTNANLRELYEHHRKNNPLATIGLKRQGMPLEYGIAKVNETNNQILSFEEKPILENLVNAGIYVFEPEIFDYISQGSDFARDVFPLLLKKKKKLLAYIFDDYWMDIGRMEDYESVHRIMSILEITKE